MSSWWLSFLSTTGWGSEENGAFHTMKNSFHNICGRRGIKRIWWGSKCSEILLCFGVKLLGYHACSSSKAHLGDTSYWVYISHYGDVIVGAIASQITSLTIVYSTVYSDADQFPAQMASDEENVSIWLRHHAYTGTEDMTSFWRNFH